MGLGLGFLLLLLISAALLIYFFITKGRHSFKILGIIWGFAILFLAFLSIIRTSATPLRLTKQEIIGEYRIDTNFYSGMNAQWQFEHFKFYITDKDSINFIVMKQEEIPIKSFRHKLIYSIGPPDIWKIKSDTLYHVIRNQPTLYRGHTKFYYVFNSVYYGNMFFRKVNH